MSTAATTAPNASVIDRGLIAQNFAAYVQGKLTQPQIDSIVKSLSANTTAYPATGSIASFVFFLKFQVTIRGGEAFNGNAGGASSPGGAALFGNVYTDNLANLYANTVSFEFQGTPVFFSILFFDSSSNLLGHFEAGAVSTVIGVGGGKGHWS